MLIGVKKRRKEVALRNPNLQIFLLNHPNHMHPTPDYDNSNSKYGYIALQFMKHCCIISTGMVGHLIVEIKPVNNGSEVGYGLSRTPDSL